MTEYIAHRVNKIDELIKTPKEYGVEVDLRDYGDRLILAHDPFTDGDDFEEYLKHYNHGTIILNIKSERIEHRVLELIRKYKVSKYFFLDSSFPMIYLLSSNGEKNIALRYSEFEKLDTIIGMAGKVNWLWIDCFTKFSLNVEDYKKIKKLDLKLCLVSPDLQGRAYEIEEYLDFLHRDGMVLDAICTKFYNINKWSR
jgi:hypothetical protein